MTHHGDGFAGSEAHWLGSEIELLSSDAGFTPKQAAEMRRLTEALANAVFSEKETCLPISAAEDLAFLCELSKNTNPIISSEPNARTPLILDIETVTNAPTLYFRKHFAEECFIARSVRAAANAPEAPISPLQENIIGAGTKDGFGFALTDEQKNAVRAILRRQFTIISGGPGTGKTSLLLRALIGILAENPEASIEIAAPTGKAANRIQESITKQFSEIDDGKLIATATKNVREKISKIVPKTLHRLLSLSAGTTRPKPILADVVIIDEASMISQNLMATLLSALPAHAKLILLGDKNQLDSVQPGHVFGDFYNAPALSRSRASLVKSHRFNDDNFVGQLAAAVLDGKNEKIPNLLSRAPENTTVEYCDEASAREQIERVLHLCLPAELKNPSPDIDPKTILHALESSRVLTPSTEGVFGVHALNAAAQKIFAPASRGEHFHGRPILVTQNAPEFSLSNGDVGLILRSPENFNFYAWFQDGNGEARSIPVVLLPKHETAYAMTIHKSQGSEFSRLGIFFPKNTRPGFYTRQLLYTAITRFKETPQSRLCFCCDPESVASAVSSDAQSHSLLPARLK